MITFIFTFTLTLLFHFASPLEINSNTVIIHNASDFIELSNNVNNDVTTYSGSTVLLGDDIDFTGYSDKFEPVGVNPYSGILFRGAFDGQGHTVSNLVMSSSKRCTALFGATNGTSFKNVVVDSSCSFLSTFTFTENITCVGGIVGYIRKSKGTEPIVENCVNMASVTYNGENEKSYAALFIGGVVGQFYSELTGFVMRNCVNYGLISFSGTHNYVSISGVLGGFFNQMFYSGHELTIENCANYGKLVHRGETGDMLGIGNIVGMTIRGKAENCIDYGTSQKNKDTIAVGKIVGGTSGQLNITKCYWTNKADTNEAYGFSYSTDLKITESHFVESNTTTLDLLNSWVSEENEKESEHKYARWIMLHLNGGGMNTVREETLIVPQLKFPVPNREGHSLIRWCTDSECTTGEYNGTLGNVTDLYAMWKANNYTVTFDYGNGTLVSESFVFNTVIIYPEAPRGEGIYGWNSSIDLMPAYDITIGPNTTPPPKNSNAGIVVCIVICAVIAAIIVLVVLITVLKTVKDKSKMTSASVGSGSGYISLTNIYPRVVERANGGSSATFEAEEEQSVEADKYADLYPAEYETPILPQALAEAGYDRSEIQSIIDRCNIAVENVGEEIPLNGFTADDAAAVALYTYDFDSDDFKKNPSNTLNKGLTGDTNNDLRRVRGMLSLVMRALRKLPRCRELTVYRGIKGIVDSSIYEIGSTIVFHGITSMSTNMSTVKDFLTMPDDMDESEDSSGTLFVIENAWGYDIQPYSVYPNEREILLEPERYFVIQGVIESDVTIVELKMLDTPLILPEVFGYGVESYV